MHIYGTEFFSVLNMAKLLKCKVYQRSKYDTVRWNMSE